MTRKKIESRICDRCVMSYPDDPDLTFAEIGIVTLQSKVDQPVDISLYHPFTGDLVDRFELPAMITMDRAYKHMLPGSAQIQSRNRIDNKGLITLSGQKKYLCSWCQLWDSRTNERRLTVLDRPWLIDRIKKAGKGKLYDAVIGLSGGIDSSYTLHKAVEEGLRVFAYSVDNGYNTPAADENIMRLVETLKVSFFRYVINKERFDELYRAYIKSGLKNLEVITDHILFAVSYEMAKQHNVKYILSGGNVATESIMPVSYGYQPRDLVQIKAVYKKFTRKNLVGLPLLSLRQYLWHRNIDRIQVVPLLDYYESYRREKSVVFLKEKYGYIPYGEKHGESTLTKWFQDTYLPRKFGIDKRRPHFSSLINSGQMTREEALKELEKPFSNIEGYCPLPFTESWLKTPKHNWTEYPNDAEQWSRWLKFFIFLKRFGWSR